MEVEDCPESDAEQARHSRSRAIMPGALRCSYEHKSPVSLFSVSSIK